MVVLLTFAEDRPLLSTLFEGKDFYLISDDFLSCAYMTTSLYSVKTLIKIVFPDLAAQKMIDEAYVDRPAWIAKTSQ